MPGDAPGFPVTISQPGSYRLSGNLTVPDLNITAIHITADHVTLDLNGFSIIGPGVCTSRPTTCPAPGRGIGVQAGGDQALGPRGVRILNGSVRGMGLLGISMTGEGSFVDRVGVDSKCRRRNERGRYRDPKRGDPKTARLESSPPQCGTAPLHRTLATASHSTSAAAWPPATSLPSMAASGFLCPSAQPSAIRCS